MSAEKTDRAARIAVIEKTCTNPETRTSPLCDTYDRLRKEFPNDGRQSPYTSEWQRIRVMSGLTRSGASAAWEQLLAHPPSAPLKHVDHSHRLEGAATAICLNPFDEQCKLRDGYTKQWTKDIEESKNSRDATIRLNQLRTTNADRGGDHKGSGLLDTERAEWEALEQLLSSKWIKQYPAVKSGRGARATKASVFDALEARIEGLYEEYEEAGTERSYKQKSDEDLGCHEGYYQVNRVLEKEGYSTTRYKLYVSDQNVRQWFTAHDAAVDVDVSPLDKTFLRKGEKKAYRIQLPTHTGGSVTLRACSKKGERLVQVEYFDGEYPKGVQTDEKRKKQEEKRIKEYYACAARAVWARKHAPYEVGFKDATLEVKQAANRKELKGTRD